MTTWEDVERMALHDAALHRLVTEVRLGRPREEALIMTVLWFSEQLARLNALEVERLKNEPARTLRLGAEGEP